MIYVNDVFYERRKEMIELELKYKIKQMPSLLGALRPEKTKIQKDYYYDTSDYALLKGGNFLRVRNNDVIEFKIDIGDDTHLYCEETSFAVNDLAQKNNEINKVFQSLSLPYEKRFHDLGEFISVYNLSLLAPVVKVRKSYKPTDNKAITVSVDDVDEIGLYIEIEYMIDSDDSSSDNYRRYKKELENFLCEENLITDEDIAMSIGYVEIYLKENNRNAYNLGKFKD
jgi:adenylate cyclase class IV